MSRRKSVDATNEVPAEAQDPAAQPADRESPAAPAADQAANGAKRTWASRFPQWGDYDAGVHLIEDRQNRRMTIKFDDKPSQAVRDVMKKEHGYRFDGEDEVWYKPINPAKPRQCRAEAEELAFKVAGMIREEKGLEPKQAMSLAL
jgi:hypothetical protein